MFLSRECEYEHPQEIEQYIAENKEALWKKPGSS
jgi:hypothetical protein